MIRACEEDPTTVTVDLGAIFQARPRHALVEIPKGIHAKPP